MSASNQPAVSGLPPAEFEHLCGEFLHGRTQPSPQLIEDLLAELQRDPSQVAKLRQQLLLDHLLHDAVSPTAGDFSQRVLQRAHRAPSGRFVQRVLLKARQRRAAPRAQVAQTVWTAACAALLVLTGWLLWHESSTDSAAPNASVFARDGLELASASAMRTVHWRGEATSAVLAPHSAIRIGGADAKQVHLLAGRIELMVAPQVPGKPMRVQAGRATAEVVGTKLAVSLATDGTALEVVEGTVRFSANAQSVLVGANLAAIADQDGLWLLSHFYRDRFARGRLVLDQPPPSGTNLVRGLPATLRQTRAITRKRPESLQVIAGAPLDQRWIAQSYLPDSQGEIVVGPHPVDGVACFQLRNLSGVPSVQLLQVGIPVVSGVYRFSLTYRTSGSAMPNFHLGMGGSYLFDLPLPQAPDQWRTALVDVQVPNGTCGFTIQNAAPEPQSMLAICDVRLVAYRK